MSLTVTNAFDLSTAEPQEIFLADVVAGLSNTPKQLPCKYFYDETGSKLFDAITELPEYYLTRTEQWIMDQHVAEMASQLGEKVMLVEFGSGSSLKTRVLLDHLQSPAAYVPLDISEEHLVGAATELRGLYPAIEILPLIADFTKPFELPTSKIKPSHPAIYFPGSTIGNFRPEEAASLLDLISGIVGEDGGLLIGVDLQKDPAIIEAAYNDSQQVTDQFNLNMLHRINRELSGDFVVDQFEHKAFYNEDEGRVEIFVVSCCDQVVRIGDQVFELAAGEHIHTEYSHKYTIDGFAEIAAKSGFSLHKSWQDPDGLFAVLHLVIEPSATDSDSQSNSLKPR